jgi:hypothetical protein
MTAHAAHHEQHRKRANRDQHQGQDGPEQAGIEQENAQRQYRQTDENPPVDAKTADLHRSPPE